MHLITGSTGNIGRGVVKLLKEHGHLGRALVRSPSRAELLPHGVDVAVGDLTDVDSLTAALRGTDAVFYLQATGGPEQPQNMVAAARAAGVRKVVMLSSVGAILKPNPVIGAGLAAREAVFRESGLDVTYLRPNGLMSNALWWVDAIKNDNRVVDAYGPGRVPVVDPDDIARVAALVLAEDGHAGHGYIMNGPEALTTEEQTGILSEVLGRTIEFTDVTPAQFAQTMIEHGTPTEEAHAVQNLNEMFRAGRAGFLADDIENLTGVAPGTFRSWCERHADDFRWDALSGAASQQPGRQHKS